MKNKYQSVENSNTISITLCNTFKEKESMVEYAVGKGKSLCCSVSALSLCVGTKRNTSEQEGNLTGGATERERSTGSTPELVKGEVKMVVHLQPAESLC